MIDLWTNTYGAEKLTSGQRWKMKRRKKKKERGERERRKRKKERGERERRKKRKRYDDRFMDEQIWG